MIRLVTMAFRNLRRNVRRTLLTAGAIAFGMAMMMITITFATGSYTAMIKTGVSQLAGHVVVQAHGYQDDREPTLLVAHSDEVAQVLRDTFPGANVTQRIQLGGLLVSPTASVGAGIAGYDPVAEAKVTDLDDKLVDGEWLGAEDTRGIVIGRSMADQLGVGLGDKLVFMGQQKGQKEMQSRLFRVRGIFRTGSAEMDGFLAAVHLHAARELLEAEDAANQVAVHLPEARRSLAAADTARAALGRDDIDVLNWKQAIPEIFALISVDKQGTDLTMAMIGLIVVLGVLNTVLMSVLERTREFGVMMAIGMPKRSLAALILLEGAALGVIGTALGLLFGLGPSTYLVNHGLDLSTWVGESFDTGGLALSAKIHGAWDWPRLAEYAVAAVFLTIGAAAWPAWRVTRLQPVDAMRHH